MVHLLSDNYLQANASFDSSLGHTTCFSLKYAGQPRYEYSIWWGANEKNPEDENTEMTGGGGGGGGALFPSMQIGGGILR